MKSNIKQFVFTALLALASVGAMAQVNNVTVGETSYIASKVSFDASHMYIYLTTGETTTIDLPHDGFNISFKMSDAEIGGGDPDDKPNPDDGGKIWIDAPAQRYAAPVINDADYLCTNPDVTCALVIDADHAYPVAKSPSVVLKTTGYEVSFADGKTFTILNASAQPKVSKLHTAVTDAAVAPTCTTGLTEGSHCSVCNTVLVAQQEVAATGSHTLVAQSAADATCTTAGHSAYWYCSNPGCDKYFSDAEGTTEIEKYSWFTTPALGHTFAEGATSGECTVCHKNIAYQGFEANAEGTANAIHWQLVKNGETDTYTLEISGMGAMKDYEELMDEDWNKYYSSPWYASISVLGSHKVSAVRIGSGITYIGKYAFAGELEQVRSVSIPEGVERIGSYAFDEVAYYSTDIEILLPASLKSLDEDALMNSYFTSVRFADNSKLESLSNRSLYTISLATVIFTGKNTPTLSDYMFPYLPIVVSYPSSWGDMTGKYGAASVTWLKDGQFGEQDKPAALSLDETKNLSLTTKGDNVWYSFTPTQSGVYKLAMNPYSKRNVYVTVYDASLSLLSRSNGFGYFETASQMEAGKTYYINVTAYDSYCNVDITLTTSATSGTFGENDALTWSFADGTLTIGGEGDLNCRINVAPYNALAKIITKVVIGKGITSIGTLAFYEARNLNAVTFEEGSMCAEVCAGAFLGCSMLSTLVLPPSCTKMFGILENSNVRDLYISAPEFQASDLSYTDKWENVINLDFYSFYKCNVYTLHQKAYDQLLAFGAIEGTTTTLHAPVTVSAKAGDGDAEELVSAYADASIPSYTFTAADLEAKGISPCAYTWKNGEDEVAYGTSFSNLTQNVTLVGTADGHHTFNEADPTRSLCSVCNHGFFRYTSENNAAVSPATASNLKDATGEALTIVSNGYVAAEGKCVMEFNAPLVTIGLNAFSSCLNLVSVTLPSSIKSIEDFAFFCEELRDVRFQSILNVSEYAFYSVAGNCQYTLALTDLSYVYTGSNQYFPTLSSVTYTRTGIKNQWGTIVVPFAVNLNGTEPYDLYEVTGVTDGALNLQKVTTLAAGTPALIRMSESAKNAETGKYDLTMTAANASVTTTGTLTATEKSGLTLTGTYSKLVLASEEQTTKPGYIISNNSFWNIATLRSDYGATEVYIGAFRAYLAGTLSSGNASQLRIGSTTDAEIETALEVLEALTSGDALETYDLNGRRLDDLQPGVNIIKRGNKSVKVIVK